jgi:hypothetical protein
MASQLTPTLVKNIHEAILYDPVLLMRMPHSNWWGLSYVVVEGRPWVAISVEGSIRLLTRRTPWLYRSGVPDVVEVIKEIASRFKKVVVKNKENESGGGYLFSMPKEFGDSGRACILAQPTQENFPWISSDIKVKPVLSEVDIPSFQASEWEQLCDIFRGQNSMPISGTSLPSPPDMDELLLTVIERTGHVDPNDEAAVSRLVDVIRSEAKKERSRLMVLRAGWSLPNNPYQEPAWLAPDMVDSYIEERVIRKLKQALQAGDGAKDFLAPPRAHTRRPSGDSAILATQGIEDGREPAKISRLP